MHYRFVLFSAILLAITTWSCSPELMINTLHQFEQGERLLNEDPIEVAYLDGFSKTRGLLWLTDRNIIFFDSNAFEDPLAIYPVQNCSDFKYARRRMLGYILSFTFEGRMVAFSLLHDHECIRTFGEWVDLEMSL